MLPVVKPEDPTSVDPPVVAGGAVEVVAPRVNDKRVERHRASAAVATAAGLTPTTAWHEGEIRWMRSSHI